MMSIIIPAYNEEEDLPRLISYLNSCDKINEMEIIVSDGGSTDNTVDLVKQAGARVIHCPVKGRAAQMNAGAKESKGSVLYFLHADSYPPKSFVRDIKESLKKGNEAGCFRLAFDDTHPLLSFYSWFTKFDIDYFRFGDQSLFITKELFQKLQGFDEELILMEDQIFVRKIKATAKFELLKSEVVTSARKYRQVGIIRLQLIFSTILILFYAGVSQERLLGFYKTRVQ